MPSYYFSLRNRHTIERRERARDYPDLQAALADAQGAARAAIDQRLRRQEPIEPQGCLDIEDEQHRPVARIMLAELAHQLS
jgi:hypothetical protein